MKSNILRSPSKCTFLFRMLRWAPFLAACVAVFTPTAPVVCQELWFKWIFERAVADALQSNMNETMVYEQQSEGESERFFERFRRRMDGSDTLVEYWNVLSTGYSRDQTWQGGIQIQSTSKNSAGIVTNRTRSEMDVTEGRLTVRYYEQTYSGQPSHIEFYDVNRRLDSVVWYASDTGQRSRAALFDYSGGNTVHEISQSAKDTVNIYYVYDGDNIDRVLVNDIERIKCDYEQGKIVKYTCRFVNGDVERVFYERSSGLILKRRAELQSPDSSMIVRSYRYVRE